MVNRKYWIRQIERAWKESSIVWLAGVRRVGKTFLCKSLDNIEYFDCELPRVRRQMEDPQSFLDDLRGKRVVLDEIHRLPNPSELLKIAADHYSSTKIVATGSSTLSASAKFRDTLAGRKTNIRLTPIILKDMEDFSKPDIKHRLLCGGLPPFFLPNRFPERKIQEWLDAFWSKDVQELFRLEKRASFLKFIELLFARSGGIFEANRFATPCEVSRPTISNYLSVLEHTMLALTVRPFSSNPSHEITSAPKVYAFDTGFVCYYRGWDELQPDNLGHLWEHFVLNELMAHNPNANIQYWRDKRGHEIDFVIAGRQRKPLAIECKWSAGQFEPSGLLSFRHRYPEGENYVAANDIDREFSQNIASTKITFIPLPGLIDRLK